MKNIILILLFFLVLFVSFKRSNPIQQRQTSYGLDNLTMIKIHGDTMKCKTVLNIKGKNHTKIHDIKLSKFTEFGFVSKSGQRIEIKIFNYNY